MPDSIDPKSVPYEDYKQLLKEKAALEAENETNKSQKRNLQSQMSQIRKKYAVPSEPKTEEADDSPPDTILSQLQDEIKQLKTELHAKERDNQPQNTPSVTHISTAPGKSPESTILTAAPPSSPHPEHNFKIFQAGCTTCGTKNEKFVPEMKCKNCKGTVGSFEAVKDMDYCPYCTEKLTAIPITEEAVRKVKEYLQTPKVQVAA